MLTDSKLAQAAAATGFRAESLEKVVRLIDLLEALRSHPFLKYRIALKGGTALNLFVFDVPRLSVDIDINYIGAVERDIMLAERPAFEQSIVAVCSRLGLQVMRAPHDHAGGKYRLSYAETSGRTGTMELDINFMLRRPLWPVTEIDSKLVGSFVARRIPVLDIHELAAGKLAALFSRAAARDLYDTRLQLSEPDLDTARLRLGFVVYGGINRRDWRTVSVDDINTSGREVDQQLVPMLRADAAPAKSDVEGWANDLVADCRRLLGRLLPLRPNEIEFLTRLNDHGQIVPDLISADPGLQALIGTHPALRWKAQNVLRYRKTERE